MCNSIIDLLAGRLSRLIYNMNQLRLLGMLHHEENLMDEWRKIL